MAAILAEKKNKKHEVWRGVWLHRIFSCQIIVYLVVSTQLKNISPFRSFPQVGVKIKTIWNHHLVVSSKKNSQVEASAGKISSLSFCGWRLHRKIHGNETLRFVPLVAGRMLSYWKRKIYVYNNLQQLLYTKHLTNIFQKTTPYHTKRLLVRSFRKTSTVYSSGCYIPPDPSRHQQKNTVLERHLCIKSSPDLFEEGLMFSQNRQGTNLIHLPTATP